MEREILSFIRKYSLGPAPDREFNKLALRVFGYQFQKNTNYRKFCEIEKKSPSNVRSWKEIPAMPVLGFKELVLTTFSAKRAVRIFRTSGTTGQGGARGAHFFESLKLYDAAIPALFSKHLLPDNKKRRFFFLMHSPGEARDSSLSYMMGFVNRKFSSPEGSFYVKKGNAQFEKLAQDLSIAKKPVVLLATAFSLKAFLDFLEASDRRLRLPADSRLMETGGFKGKMKEVSKRALYADCERLLGILKKNCVSEYGMTELTSQYYCSNPGGVFEGPAWMKTMVLDVKTGREVKKGRTGILKHVDLANLGSVAAIETEDLGRMKGRGFEVLGRAGRAELRGCSLSYEKFIRS